MKIALETLGCKLNQAETEALARQLTEAGHCVVASVAEADIYILNTCTVTQMADAKSRHLLRLAHRRNSKALLVATGCYAQRAREELAEVDGVRLVVSVEEKSALLRLLDESGCLHSGEIGRQTVDETVSRTRAFIKIQDGCSKFCSYCIVPVVRGREKSVAADRVVDEIKQRISGGVKEVVLTGTEVGAYDDKGVTLKGLLERILAETGVTRLRLSSLQPQEISTELIGLWRDSRLCPHFHLSLQSGSDAVLRRMGRGYSTSDFQQAISLIRSLVPDVAITTDIIAGFPGETVEEFGESCEFCHKMEFARIHVFKYSQRPGTTAAAMQGQVTDNVISRRTHVLLNLARESSEQFRLQFSGRITPVLWEHKSGGVRSGHTGNYIKVTARSDNDLSNRLLDVKLGELRGEGMWGEVVGD